MLLLGPKCTCIGSRSMHLPWCIVHWHPSASFLEFLYVVRILKGRFIISPIKPLPNIGFPILSLPSLKRVFGGSRIVRKVNETHAVSLLRSSSLDPGGVDSHYLTWGLESIEVDIKAWKKSSYFLLLNHFVYHMLVHTAATAERFDILEGTGSLVSSATIPASLHIILFYIEFSLEKSDRVLKESMRIIPSRRLWYHRVFLSSKECNKFLL